MKTQLLLCCSLSFSLSLSMNICLVFFRIAYRVIIKPTIIGSSHLECLNWEAYSCNARYRTTRSQNFAWSSRFLWWNASLDSTVRRWFWCIKNTSITDIGYHLHRIFANQVLCCCGDKTFDCLTRSLRMNYEAPVNASKSKPKSILQYLEHVYATISRCSVPRHFSICHEGKVDSKVAAYRTSSLCKSARTCVSLMLGSHLLRTSKHPSLCKSAQTWASLTLGSHLLRTSNLQQIMYLPSI